MKQKIKAIFRKAYSKLFRKKTRGDIWGRSFDGTSLNQYDPRLNIAAIIAQGVWSNAAYIRPAVVELQKAAAIKGEILTNDEITEGILWMVAQLATKQADALIAECGKGGENL